MLFNTWSGLVRTALIGVLAYIALVLLLRFPANEPIENERL